MSEAGLRHTRKLTIIAQDPGVRDANGQILTAEIEVPVEELEPGPRGYRVHVVDFDVSTNTLYRPLELNCGPRPLPRSLLRRGRHAGGLPGIQSAPP